MHGLEGEYCQDVNFVYLDVDDGNTRVYKDALGFVYQPHIFLLDGEGNIITQWVGYVQAEELESAIVSAIGQ